MTDYHEDQHQDGKPNILITNIHLDDYTVVGSPRNTIFIFFTFFTVLPVNLSTFLLIKYWYDMHTYL